MLHQISIRLFFSIIAISLYSCGPLKRQDSVELQSLMGKQVELTSEWHAQLPDSLQNTTSVKIIIIVDSMECTMCSMELRNWYLQKVDLAALKLHPEIIFILNQRTEIDAELDSTLHEFQFQYILDKNKQFSFKNGLPANPIFHTFLLDRNNRVVLVGSPIGNPKMWTLYKQTIAKLATNDEQLSSAATMQ